MQRAHDPQRLLRAGNLIERGKVNRKGEGEYEVQGSYGVRYVNLNIDLPCDCEDCYYRGQRIRNMCKHTLAARMMNGDTALLIAWGSELVKRVERNKELSRARRPRRSVKANG